MGMALLLFALPSCRDGGKDGAAAPDPPGAPVAGLEVVFLDSSLSEGGEPYRTNIITDPSDALAYVDGIYVGTTPFTLSFSGVHVLTLVQPGSAWYQEVICSPGLAAPAVLPTGPVLTVALERGGPPRMELIETLARDLAPPVPVETAFGWQADILDFPGAALRDGYPSPDGRRLALLIDYPLSGHPGAGAAVLWLVELTTGRVERLAERAFGSLGRRLFVSGLTVAGWLDDRRLAVVADDPDLVWADARSPERFQPGWRLLVFDVAAATVSPGGAYAGYLTGRGLGRCWVGRTDAAEHVYFVAPGPTDDNLVRFDVATAAVATVAGGLHRASGDHHDKFHVAPDGLTVAYGYGFGGVDGRGLYSLPGGEYAPGPPYLGSQRPVITAAPLWSPSSKTLAFIVAEPGRPWTWLSGGDDLLLLGNAIVFSDSGGREVGRVEETGRLWTRIAWSATADTLLAVGVRVNGTPGGQGGELLIQDGLFLIDVSGRYEWAVKGAEASRMWPFYPEFCPGWFIVGREEESTFSYFLLPEKRGTLPGPGTGPAGSIAVSGEPAACLSAPPGAAGPPVLITLDWDRDPVVSLVSLGAELAQGTLTAVGVDLAGYEVWRFAPGDRPAPVLLAAGVNQRGQTRLFIFIWERAYELLKGED